MDRKQIAYYLAVLAEENAMLRERAQRAESMNADLEAANQELARDYITARCRANELQARAFALMRLMRDWRQVAREAQANQPAGIPVAGAFSAQTTEDDWKAIWAGVEAGEDGKATKQ